MTAMCMDDDHSFWIGTRHGGLNHYSAADGSDEVYDIDNIRSVLAVDDVVYVGTRVTGWVILDKRTGRTTTFPIPSDVNDFIRMKLRSKVHEQINQWSVKLNYFS